MGEGGGEEYGTHCVAGFEVLGAVAAADAVVAFVFGVGEMEEVEHEEEDGGGEGWFHVGVWVLLWCGVGGLRCWL